MVNKTRPKVNNLYGSHSHRASDTSQKSQSYNTTHSSTSQEPVEGMGRWVWHKMFCMLLGYTSGKSTSLPKEIWLGSPDYFSVWEGGVWERCYVDILSYSWKGNHMICM